MSDREASVLRQAIPPVRLLLPSVLLGGLSAASTVALLACSAWLIVRASEQPPVLYLSLAIVGVRAFALGRAVFRYLERLSGHDASFRQLAEIRARVFERIVPFAPDGLGATRRGDLLTRFVDDVDELQNVPLRVVQPVASAVIVLALAVVGLAIVAPGSALGVLGCLVVGIVVAVLVQLDGITRSEQRIAPLRGELRAAMLEHVEAIDVLVAFDAADADRRRVDELAARLQRATRARAAASGAASAVMSAIGGFAVLASLAAAVPLLDGGRIDGPTFAVLCLVPLAIAEVAAAIPLAAGALRFARVSARRVAEAVPATLPDELPEPPADPVAAPSAAHGVGIRLRDVRASWPRIASGPDDPPDDGPDDEPDGAPGGLVRVPPVLDGVDLDLEAGEHLLVRGASGAGKTTLAHVLVRFLDYRGSYRIAGVEASTLDPGAVRRLVGLVEQRPWLFDESVRQNLLFARDTASDADLREALERVGLADWVAARGGLDARVGERGALVSGGQAQRLALARAMLAEFPVLVLDEPTADVDRPRARALLADLMGAAARAGRSVVLISHDDLAVEFVDRVRRDRRRAGAARPIVRDRETAGDDRHAVGWRDAAARPKPPARRLARPGRRLRGVLLHRGPCRVARRRHGCLGGRQRPRRRACDERVRHRRRGGRHGRTDHARGPRPPRARGRGIRVRRARRPPRRAARRRRHRRGRPRRAPRLVRVVRVRARCAAGRGARRRRADPRRRLPLRRSGDRVRPSGARDAPRLARARRRRRRHH